MGSRQNGISAVDRLRRWLHVPAALGACWVTLLAAAEDPVRSDLNVAGDLKPATFVCDPPACRPSTPTSSAKSIDPLLHLADSAELNADHVPLDAVENALMGQVAPPVASPSTPPTTGRPAPVPTPVPQAGFVQAPPQGFRVRRNPNYVPGSLPRERPQFIIADDQQASCGSLEMSKLELFMADHPGLGCFRLNVAENNSPVPTDRIYMRYNHLHNALQEDFRPLVGRDGLYDLNVDRFVFGIEKTLFNEMASIEVRLPTAVELTPDPTIWLIDSETNLPYSDQQFVLKNIGVLGKFVIAETETWLVSAGYAFDLPTAPGVDFRMRVLDTYPFVTELPNPIELPINNRFHMRVNNEVINWSPFVGFVWQPKPRWYAQGIVQWDHPLTTSTVTVDQVVASARRPLQDPVVQHEEGEFFEQDLMRMNISQGFFVLRDRPGKLTNWTMSSELNYTTTLEDARLTTFDLQVIHPDNAPILANIAPERLRAESKLGNTANRVDVLNLTLANTFEFFGRTSVGSGFVVPLRQGADKRFDFELVVQINHRY